jgi:hypothetical protein
MTGFRVRAVAVAAALSLLPASAGLASECSDMSKALSAVHDKLNYKPDMPLAKRCALMGEMVSLLQASRQVFSECLEDNDRIKKLVDGDAVIRGIATELAKACL